MSIEGPRRTVSQGRGIADPGPATKTLKSLPQIASLGTSPVSIPQNIHSHLWEIRNQYISDFYDKQGQGIKMDLA